MFGEASEGYINSAGLHDDGSSAAYASLCGANATSSNGLYEISYTPTRRAQTATSEAIMVEEIGDDYHSYEQKLKRKDGDLYASLATFRRQSAPPVANPFRAQVRFMFF